MATIEELYETVKELDLRSKLPELILDTKKSMLDLIKGDLILGITPKNDKIQPKYKSPYYAKKKNALNSLPGIGVPDLKVTGDYYDLLDVTVTTDEYEVESTVEYAKASSITQYGPDVLLLSEQGKQEYVENSLFPAISGYITGKTGLELT